LTVEYQIGQVEPIPEPASGLLALLAALAFAAHPRRRIRRLPT
jgi:MYXO-CTERM domain-containing protein